MSKQVEPKEVGNWVKGRERSIIRYVEVFATLQF